MSYAFSFYKTFEKDNFWGLTKKVLTKIYLKNK